MVLKSRLRAPDWSASNNPAKEAKCRKHPLPNNNDPNADNDPWFYDEEEALHICNGTYDGYVCPFREVCLNLALVNNEQAGCFGGMTTTQRRWVRRNRDLIPRYAWDDSESWRTLVPDTRELEELQDAAENKGEDSAQSTQA